MENGQLFFYGLIALFLLVQVRRWLAARGIPRYDADAVSERLRGGAVLVDVRTPAERSQRSIPGSVHLPLTELMKRPDALDRYRDREVIFYCATGNRSLSAAVRARQAGLTVGHLEGGIAAWHR